MEGGQGGAEGDGWIIIDRKFSKKKNKQGEPDGEGCDQVTKGDRRQTFIIVGSVVAAVRGTLIRKRHISGFIV